jgi:hypothetical protein
MDIKPLHSALMFVLPISISSNASLLSNRVARWFVFKPKIPILVKLGGPWNGKLYV